MWEFACAYYRNGMVLDRFQAGFRYADCANQGRKTELETRLGHWAVSFDQLFFFLIEFSVPPQFFLSLTFTMVDPLSPHLAPCGLSAHALLTVSSCSPAESPRLIPPVPPGAVALEHAQFISVSGPGPWRRRPRANLSPRFLYLTKKELIVRHIILSAILGGYSIHAPTWLYSAALDWALYWVDQVSGKQDTTRTWEFDGQERRRPRPPACYLGTMPSSRDSNRIRASVYDVFLELGALDANSRVADWFFTDPSCVLPNPDEVAWRSPRDTVRFAHGSKHPQVFHLQPPPKMAQKNIITSKPQRPACIESSRPTSPPQHISATNSSTSSCDTSSPSSACDGSGTDETPMSAFSSASESSMETRGRSNPAFTDTRTKTLPSLPLTRERSGLIRTVSSSSVARAKSLFRRRRSKASVGTTANAADERERDEALTQWHKVSSLLPRVHNPSVDNGLVPLSPPRPQSGSRRVPSGSCEDTGRATSESPVTIPPRRSLFRSLSRKRREAPPRLLHVPEPTNRVSADSTCPWGPDTPIVFVAPIDTPGPTPLHTAALRRFSDVTSMTVHPQSVSCTPSSMAFPSSVVFPPWDEEPAVRRRSYYARSESSLHDALAVASAASPYDLNSQTGSGERIRRGREPAFPSSPLLSEPLGGELSREATIRRYREFSETLAWW
ncbi:hypothetical protein DFH06DRAFT_1353779 [Mycena polygramma]|nr:hypothetical protein DFH06DRAFT_1353779 [Mycena polygramma]